MRYYLDVMKKYAVFHGRARRKEYWMFFLLNFCIAIVIVFTLGIIGLVLGFGINFGRVVNIIYNLAVIIPSIAVAVRRLHDIGASGWWLLCPLVNIVLLCLDSQQEENEYGPNPKTA